MHNRGSLGKVYSVMRLDALEKVISFASIAEIESIIVDAVRHGECTSTYPLRPRTPKLFLSLCVLSGMKGSMIAVVYSTIAGVCFADAL